MNMKCPKCLYNWEHSPDCEYSPNEKVRNQLRTELADKIASMPDKWFEAPWGLQPWDSSVIGQRLITGQIITSNEVLYVRLYDVLDTLEGVANEQD